MLFPRLHNLCTQRLHFFIQTVHNAHCSPWLAAETMYPAVGREHQTICTSKKWLQHPRRLSVVFEFRKQRGEPAGAAN